MYIMLWTLGPLGPITLLVQHTYTCIALYLHRTLILVLHFTCTAYLCLLYKALMYIFSLRNTIQSSSISNMEKLYFHH